MAATELWYIDTLPLDTTFTPLQVLGSAIPLRGLQDANIRWKPMPIRPMSRPRLQDKIKKSARFSNLHSNSSLWISLNGVNSGDIHVASSSNWTFFGLSVPCIRNIFWRSLQPPTDESKVCVGQIRWAGDCGCVVSLTGVAWFKNHLVCGKG